MASLLIKNIPREVHQWLKRGAGRNRRSMSQQAIVILRAEARVRSCNHTFRRTGAKSRLQNLDSV